nr:hypothetical protein [Actinomycetales bacterium]
MSEATTEARTALGSIETPGIPTPADTSGARGEVERPIVDSAPLGPGEIVVTFDGEEWDMSGAVVTCERNGARLVATVEGQVADGMYWITLWVTEAGVSVLDLGVGYGVDAQRDGHKGHYWPTGLPGEQPLKAERDGAWYRVWGETFFMVNRPSGTTESISTPFEMSLRCPADGEG